MKRDVSRFYNRYAELRKVRRADSHAGYYLYWVGSRLGKTHFHLGTPSFSLHTHSFDFREIDKLGVSHHALPLISAHARCR